MSITCKEPRVTTRNPRARYPTPMSNHANQPDSPLAGRRIFLIVHALELGGGERQALQFADHLKNQCRAHVEIWGMTEPGRLIDMAHAAGIPVRHVPFVRCAGRLKEAWRLFRFASALRRAKPDALVSFDMIANLVCGLTWRFTGAGGCIWRQMNAGTIRLNRRIERAALRRTPLFVSNSDHGANFLRETLHVDPSRIHVIRNVLIINPPQADREQWRQRLSLTPDQFTAAMLATLHPTKDHATLVRAWRLVVDRYTGPSPAPRLLLAGRKSATAPAVESLIAELDLNDHVDLLGDVSDIAGLISAIDLGVHVSPAEGYPNAVTECMALGLPIVAADNPGVREVLRPDDNHALVPQQDPQALADRVLTYAHDESARRAAGDRNRAHAVAQHDAEKSGAQLAQLIATLIH